MDSERVAQVKEFLADSRGVVRSALPFIAGGGIVGALLGSALGSPANGFRVGVILGGTWAFVRLVRKARDGA
jgi:hypothetical protein